MIKLDLRGKYFRVFGNQTNAWIEVGIGHFQPLFINLVLYVSRCFYNYLFLDGKFVYYIIKFYQIALKRYRIRYLFLIKLIR